MMHFLMILQTTVVDIFRPENAGDTLKLIMNWDGMGKMILERYLLEQKEEKPPFKYRCHVSVSWMLMAQSSIDVVPGVHPPEQPISVSRP